MDEEQAVNIIGKEVYTVDYKDCTITSDKVVSVREVSNNKCYKYQTVTQKGGAIVEPFFTWEEAYSSLVAHFEARLDVAIGDLNRAMSVCKDSVEY